MNLGFYRTFSAFVIVLLVFSGIAISMDSSTLGENELCGNYGWQFSEQSWNNTQRNNFWRLDQGSAIIPFDIYQFLELENSTALFSDDDNMESMGFIPDITTECNPKGLPVGLTHIADNNSLGITCAGCHSRVIEFNNERIFVDGASGKINFAYFVSQLHAALTATLAEPDKMQRLIARLNTQYSEQEVIALVEQSNANMAEFAHLTGTLYADKHTMGYGRMDAIGGIYNLITVKALGIEDNFHQPDAPVDIPHLWGTSHIDVVQWNGSAPNRIPWGELARNIGQVIGVFGELEITQDPESGKVQFQTSANIGNLITLQHHVNDLTSPAWPDFFPAIDQSLLERGEHVYKRSCQACHQILETQHAPFDAVMLKVKDVGTDPVAAKNFILGESQTGVLNGAYKSVFFGKQLTYYEPSYMVLLAVVAGAVVDEWQNALRDFNWFEERRIYDDSLMFYKARPLNGIWATAPYLHNGSVPNMQALLATPDERPTYFYVGSEVYQPEVMGFVDEHSEHTSLFDTTLKGNSNKGHNYGTELLERDKRALIEFMKTL